MELSKANLGQRAGWPMRAAATMVVRSTQPLWQRVAGVGLNEAEIQRRKAERARQKAELGAAIMREAVSRNDQPDRELHYIGEATLAMAVAEAGDRPNDMVTQAAVNEVAASVPMALGENPLVSPQVADKVAMLLGESRQYLNDVAQ